MGNSKSQSRPVSDFLLSVDYGLCHGPVDALNMVWVKDKPILCGWYDRRSDIEVNQPDLFGGDDAEGGVIGTLEFYTGDFAQEASEDLAERMGRTPETAPGYRGIAHLFFRGIRTTPAPPSSGLYQYVSAQALGTSLFRPDAAQGWRWGSNNPYFPPVKANVTRLPGKDVFQPFREIWPIQEIDGSGFTVSWTTTLEVKTLPVWEYLITGIPKSPPVPMTVLVNMEEALGAKQEDIDAGLYSTSIAYGPTAENPWSLVDGTAFYAVAAVKMHNAATNGGAGPDTPFYPSLPPLNDEVLSATELNPSSVGVGPVTLAPGTHWLQLQWYYYTAYTFNIVDALGRAIIGPKTQMGETHCTVDGTIGVLPNANPAYIIWECMTNQDWGKGEPETNIDYDSILAAAELFHGESFGLSFIFNAQDEIETFVQEVLDHVQAFWFIDPATGLWTLKPLRADYDIETLPVLDPSNCVLSNRKRRLWGETINEIVVTYTDPRTEEPATVQAQDLGNIAIQGGVVSETRDYVGIRDPFLAQIVADRDVREAAYPLFSATATVNRQRWGVRPGDVFKLNWPEDGIGQIVVRVMSVDYGEPGDREIKLELTEDIFAIEQAEYRAPQQGLWSDPTSAPAVLPRQAAMTVPYPSMVLNGAAFADEEYPEVAVALFGDDPANRPLSIGVVTEAPDATGGSTTRQVAAIRPTRSSVTPEALAAEAESRLPRGLVDTIYRQATEPGDMLMLGTTETESELVMLQQYDDLTDEWVISRGVWDTVPLEWPAGSVIWMFADAGPTDPITRSSGETVTYRLLPRSTLAVLSLDESADLTAVTTDRPYAPFRPANAQLDAQGFGGINYDDPFPATVTATWETRNRLTEDAVASLWVEGADAAPEAGQTVTLRITDIYGEVYQDLTGLAGNSYVIPISEFPTLGQGFVQFLSERDGIESVFGAKRAYDFRGTVGYGLRYGLGYGGV
ncbi:tail protein [Ruegeria phage DSS3-P1]|uniref:tail protein n=1 Tax=Ruegeria phage DSS3-P1 TaxID=1555208 RepID=UPI0002357D40|nr:tail protein [Ruegeria phage DSS3-P1]YP_009997260.1 tail protein [Ruegeria phage vB_RpoS-V18]YP_009997342.1 tail protein [Ruegeria phage vB_RpoS-V11]YP_009997425.1 tail protein [Ruegeria phage vB_RpoS-V7]AET42298.1 hypothetical protein SDSG_00032 [Ruegeria phage DSS3-P1]AIT13278.1 putative tail protein [Ruegeria phage DSS3-P1]AWY08747.1 putative tail protein [Ruegeria phage vB_RpoS-V7]AWY08919.1 putative tail protein [Ruegeria phage vB_RpoS-V18]AWY09083.1 putative tail protein [Ruegeria 